MICEESSGKPREGRSRWRRSRHRVGALAPDGGQPGDLQRTLHVDAAAGNDDGDGLDAGHGVAHARPGQRLGHRRRHRAAAGHLLRAAHRAERVGDRGPAHPVPELSRGDAVLDGGRSGVAAWLDARSYIVVERLWIQNVAGYAVQISSGGHHNVVRDAYITRCGTASVWVTPSRSANRATTSSNEPDGRHRRRAGNSGDSIYVVSGAHRNRILNNTVQDAGTA